MFLKFCSVIVISFLVAGCSINANAELMNTLNKIDGTNNKVNKKHILTNKIIKKNSKKFQLDNIDVKLNIKNKMHVGYSYEDDYPHNEMAFFFKKSNNKKSLFMIEQSENTYINNSYINYEDLKDGAKYFRGYIAYLYNGKPIMPAKSIIQPIKNKKFYILLWGNLCAIYDGKSNKYEFLGKFVTLQDLDNDNIPEIVVVTNPSYNKYFIEAYKIIQNKDGSTSVGLFAKNKTKVNFFEDFYGTRIIIKYFKNDNIIIPSFVQYTPNEQSDQKYGKKYYEELYEKWNKNNNLLYDTSSLNVNLDTVPVKDLYELKKYYNLNVKINELMNYKFSMNENKELHCLKKYMHSPSVFPANDLILCRGGSGVFNLPNGKFIIKDFYNDYENVLIKKGKLYNRNFFFITSNNYIIIYDIESGNAKYFKLSKLLGYKPYKVVYFSEHELIVFRNNQDLVEYNIDYIKSKIKKVKW